YRRRFQLALTIGISLFATIILFVFMHVLKVAPGILIFDLLASLYRVVIAYFISLFISVFLAILVTRNPLVEDIFLPILDVLQSFPSFAILPIATLWFGASSLTAIVFLVITIIWPVLFNIISGIKNMRGDTSEAATIFGAIGIKRIWHFLLPALFPAIVTGSIIGWGEAWDAIIGAEIIGISTGIGAFLSNASKAGNGKVLAFGIIALLFFVFFLNKLIWLPLLKKSTQFSNED
ncbi:MAG TPA: ABC transporter permease subunit, partial [Candidatus Saccharimonadales bacterium]|nr:ABC transporter permease subunit [Candidatus Saccharimonadales bacterium]